MKVSRKSSSLAAALALLVGFTLSACGDKEQGDSAGSSSATTDGSDLTKATFMTATSEAASKAKSAHVSMDIGAGGQTVTAEADVAVGSSPEDTAMTMTMDMGAAGAGTFEMRIVDQIFYLNFGSMTQDKFTKVDLTDESNPIAKQYGAIMDQMDPAKQLHDLSEAVVAVEKKGEPEELDGVQAQPYRVVLDSTKIPALAELPGGAAAQIPDRINYTMYIGPDNLPRRFISDMAGTTMTMDYSKWGEPVDIKAPDPSEVSDKDLSELMGAMPTPSV
jgi:hypothetical protein